MYVDERGDADLPAVLFLHGAGASGQMWREHVGRLADRFHCLAPDLPGFGRSNQLDFLSRTVTSDLVAALVAARVPAGRTHVVALSWGGGIAHTLLDRHPALVDRAVIDGAGILTSRTGPLVLAGVAAVAPFLHTRPVTGFFARLIGMDGQGRADLRASSPPAFRAAFVEGFRSGVSRVEIRAPSPTLLVAGEKERLVRSSNAAQAALMPNAAARYAPGLGHGWLARATDLHVRMVEAWLTASELPAELRVDPPSPATLRRLRHELGEEAYGALGVGAAGDGARRALEP
jgi:pimeloyl-ACP methyl ester carboxylesterase